MRIKKVMLLWFGLLTSLCLSAQILAPAEWSCELSNDTIQIGDEAILVFKVELDDTWHLYSNIQNYELGPLAAEFEFEPNKGYSLIGKTVPINFKTEYDDVFEVDVNYFERTAEFRQKVKILSPNTTIRGTYVYQVCTTVDGKCIMGDDEFEIVVNVAD